MEDLTGLVTAADPRTHKERMLAGEWFWGPDPELLREQILIAPRTLVAGNPARIIRELAPDEAPVSD